MTRAAALVAGEELLLASVDLGGGLRRNELSVPGLHCASCIRAVESGLGCLPGVTGARVNLSTKRASVTWRGNKPPDLLGTLSALGYAGHLTEAADRQKDPELGRLIRALAVAGFTSMNIMLLSVSVWSGTDPATRQAFHWISAALALVCLVYSGRIFFRSAWRALLRRGRTNMDVPISIGIILAFVLSLYDTATHGNHAYFDATASLVFFLLIGRTLDYMMREKARVAVLGLARLTPRGATVLSDNGSRAYTAINDILPGMRIVLAAGDRIPVDGEIIGGQSDLDCAVATGESTPRPVQPGATVAAGMLNLSGPLVMVATARAEASFLAEMARLMEAAEGGRARYRRIADRAAGLYSPVVHAMAACAFAGWMLVTGDWHHAATIAIAVLIITCPCALGLAVPMVQVVAARRLFDAGIVVRDGSGLERLAEIDTVAFDKTGTLTLGRPSVRGSRAVDAAMLSTAAELAGHSSHPLSRAIAVAAAPSNLGFSNITEHAGLGVGADAAGSHWRLGRADWALARPSAAARGTILARDGIEVARFAFEDELRPDARAAVDALRDAGLDILVLSGDEPSAVAATAAQLGIVDSAAGLLPAAKVARLAKEAGAGRRVLMVGDGINDAPALAAAHVSVAPANAAEIGRNAADFVFLREGLDAVPTAVAIARRARRLVRQNFALAITYNALALPVAFSGLVTPLIAALAMSLSSVLVVANAFRLRAPDLRAVPAWWSSFRVAGGALQPGAAR